MDQRHVLAMVVHVRHSLRRRPGLGPDCRHRLAQQRDATVHAGVLRANLLPLVSGVQLHLLACTDRGPERDVAKSRLGNQAEELMAGYDPIGESRARRAWDAFAANALAAPCAMLLCGIGAFLGIYLFIVLTWDSKAMTPCFSTCCVEQICCHACALCHSALRCNASTLAPGPTPH
jgi:hypothetical protein